MSYISNRISGLTTLSSFTATVIQDNSPSRYANTAGKGTLFQVGYEYTGINFYKDASRPPKLRILSVFRPLISGNPNSNNDTYVAFSVYDYTLGRFRGPYCRKSAPDSQPVYNDFYVTTIDKFGKNYGNVFTSSSGSSTTTFTAPTASFSSTLNTTIGGIALTVSSGHYTGCFTFGGSRNSTIDFNGFFSLSGLNGSYCFYTIGENGSPKAFRNTVDDTKYTSNIYPNLTPPTGKFTSEWRCSPICSLDNAGYSPLVRPNNRGAIKYVSAGNPDPGSAFNNGVTEPTEVWVTADYTAWLDFFSGKLFANSGGAQGTAGYAPAGYYGVSDYNAYAYWDGSSFGTVSEYGGGGGASYQKFQFYGPAMDPEMACAETGERIEYFEGFTDINVSTEPTDGQTVYGDSMGSSAAGWIQSGMWYKVFDGGFNSLGYSVTMEPSGSITMSMRCR